MAAKNELAVPAIRLSSSQNINTSTDQATRKQKFTVSSARTYADMVQVHADAKFGDSLYAGSNYVSLANFLQKPYRRGTSSISISVDKSDEEDPNLVTLYDLRLPEKDKHRIEQFSRVDNFVQTCERKRKQASPSLLLFLRGYPSPEWLNNIGWLCNIDPEFILRHLNFAQSATERGYFTTPNLPSSNANILSLRLPTIGYRQFDKNITQKEIEELRRTAESKMQEYQSDLKLEKDIQPGDSVVRSFAVHDQEHYSMEQDISVCVNEFGKGWITVVWLDHGHDLMQTPGPWSTTVTRTHRWKTNIVPTILHRPRIALKTAHISGNRPSISIQAGQFPQSGSIIHAHYGRFLDVATSANDPFYTLSELFSFCASAETQFLNMIEQKISIEMENFARGDNCRMTEEGVHGLTLSNLIYNRSILDQHVVRLKDCVAFVEGSGAMKWPKASEERQKAKATSTSQALLADFQYLLGKATTLAQTCERGMGIASNNAMVAESRTAIDHAKRMSKLTLLAFFFVPASFTTSLFGMNFEQFGTGKLSIWAWIVVLVTTYAVALIMLYVDMVKLWKNLLAARRDQR